MALTEEQQQALLTFAQTFQQEYIPQMAALHFRLEQVPDLPEDILREHALLFKNIRWNFEHTANVLNDPE